MTEKAQLQWMFFDFSFQHFSCVFKWASVSELTWSMVKNMMMEVEEQNTFRYEHRAASHTPTRVWLDLEYKNS